MVAETHGGVHVASVPLDAVVCYAAERVVVPMRLIFHGVVHIVGLECDLLFHCNLQERQEDFYQVEIGCEITECLLNFVKHLGGLLMVAGVAVEHIVDDEQHSQSGGCFKEVECFFAQFWRGKHSWKRVLLDA